MNVLIYCFCTWVLFVLFLWSVWQVLQEGISQLSRLHKISYSDCEFFTNDYGLNVRCDLLVLVQRRLLAVLTLNQEPVLVMLVSNVAVSFNRNIFWGGF